METTSISQMWIIGIVSAIITGIVGVVATQYVRRIKTIMKKDIHIHTTASKAMIFIIKYPIPISGLVWVLFDPQIPCNKFVVFFIAIILAFILFCLIFDFVLVFLAVLNKSINNTKGLVDGIHDDIKKFRISLQERAAKSDPHFPKP